MRVTEKVVDRKVCYFWHYCRLGRRNRRGWLHKGISHLCEKDNCGQAEEEHAAIEGCCRRRRHVVDCFLFFFRGCGKDMQNRMMQFKSIPIAQLDVADAVPFSRFG